MIYSVGGFVRETIIYNRNEYQAVEEMMLFNLKSFEMLQPEHLEKYELIKHTRLSGKNSELRVDLKYNYDNSYIISHYVDVLHDRGWKVEEINDDRLVMSKMDILLSKNIRVLFELKKVSSEIWCINMMYQNESTQIV